MVPPAHAGIDPEGYVMGLITQRFPRPRGPLRRISFPPDVTAG